jgi:acyl-coenzyme A thioesterase PaaI-like protein
MIVHYRHRPKRPRKPAQPVEIAVPRIVHHTRRRQAWQPLAEDPEADQRVAAFMARMIPASAGQMSA